MPDLFGNDDPREFYVNCPVCGYTHRHGTEEEYRVALEDIKRGVDRAYVQQEGLRKHRELHSQKKQGE